MPPTNNMEHKITPKQHAFLVGLAGQSGPAPLSQFKSMKPAERAPLIQQALVEEKREKRSLHVSITDAGREWIRNHPEPPKPEKKSRVRAKPAMGFPNWNQRLFLLRLAFSESDSRGEPISSLLKAAERTALVKERLVDERKEKRTSKFVLADAGWQWVEAHLADAVEVGGLANSVVSMAMFHIARFLKANDLRLADLVRARRSVPQAEVETDNHAAPDGDGIRDAIREACLRIGGGENVKRIRLARLRSELDRWGRRALDDALLDLSLAGDLVLYPLDDPREILPEDREAEFRTPSGEARHLVYWTQN